MKITKVTIKKGRYEKQPYVITIDPHGKAEPYKMKQRYSSRAAARQGVLRHLEGRTNDGIGRPVFPAKLVYFTQDGVLIQITYK